MQVNQKELASVLGISPRRIQQLAAQNGMFKSKMGSKYNLAECVQEFIVFKVESETNGKNDLDYWEEKAKHEEAKRKITQMKLARMKRESFDASDVEDAWAELLLAFKDEMQAIPHKLAPLLVGIEDMAEVDRTIEAEINSALMTLSAFDVDKIESREDLTEDDDNDGEYQEVPPAAAPASATRQKSNRKRVGGRKS